ncbi:hypothetical protein PybrP1_006842 [[Pythium] brassicae (nom. inval.)]|nr:hypothetical protein PybrP1_006842 [[Pythium] brassicae (nom. inval.)]
MAPSITKSLIVATAVASSAVLFDATDAHQYVMLPTPTFNVKTRDEQLNPLAFLENQGYKTEEDFNGWLTKNGYKSLRAFMDDKTAYKTKSANFECGWTTLPGRRQPIPTTRQIRSTGYTHDGPCEVWLDNTRVMYGKNCHADFPGKTHSLDYSSCKGSCTLRWYWMGLRFLKKKWSWQVYKNCVSLGSGRRLEGEESELSLALGNSTTEA